MSLGESRLRALLAGIVILLAGGPVAGAVLLGVLHGDSPCILCWAQRTSMALIALTALFVLRYGPRPRYLGVTILLGAWGAWMALRHSALHLARDVGQGFSAPILGLHTYTWSFVVHAAVIVVAGALLLALREVSSDGAPRPLSRLGTFAMGLFGVVILANAAQAFVSTGPPPFIGQADPVRFSLNPAHWVWGGHEELEGRISLRGMWTIPQPDPAGVDADPANGPLAATGALTPMGERRIAVPHDGDISDFAWDSARSRYAVTTTGFRVLFLDSALARVTGAVTLDRGFSVDLTAPAGAAFLGDTLAVVSTNKSYVLLRQDSAADEAAMWRRFLATSGGVAELRRARFATVRARQLYVLSLAFDAARHELITVTVPSPRHRRLVISRFARRDWLLSSEFEPRLDSGLVLRDGRALAEYYVTGATVASGVLYVVSAAWSTVLAIDLASGSVRAAWTAPGITRPAGIVVRAGEILIAQEDGRVLVFARPRW